MSYPENCLVTISNTEQCATQQVFITKLRIVDFDTVAPLITCGDCNPSVDPAWDGTLTADFSGIAPGDPPIYLAENVSLGGNNINAQVYYGPPWVLNIGCDGYAGDAVFQGLKGGDTGAGTYNVNGFATLCSAITQITLEAVEDGSPTEVTDCIAAGDNTTTVSNLTESQKSFIQNWLNYQAAADAQYNADHDAAGYNRSGYPTGGINVSVDTKPNDSSVGSWTPFGRLTIRESATTDFNVPGGTLILTIPFNFVFRPGVGTISTTGTDITAASFVASGNKITITFTVAATATLDEIIIDGLQIQPNAGVISYSMVYPSDVLIRASADPGTAVIDNISEDLTVFSQLNLSPGQAAKLSVTTQPAGATVGAPFGTQPVIQLLDQYGNINSTDNITVVSAARLHGTGSLSGTTDVTAVNGVVTFTNLQLSATGVHDLRFFVRGLSSYIRGVISDDFTVT